MIDPESDTLQLGGRTIDDGFAVDTGFEHYLVVVGRYGAGFAGTLVVVNRVVPVCKISSRYHIERIARSPFANLALQRLPHAAVERLQLRSHVRGVERRIVVLRSPVAVGRG